MLGMWRKVIHFKSVYIDICRDTVVGLHISRNFAYKYAVSLKIYLIFHNFSYGSSSVYVNFETE